jgi:hypothetical protein
MKDEERGHVYKGLGQTRHGTIQKWDCECGAVLHMSRGGMKIVAHNIECELVCPSAQTKITRRRSANKPKY